MNRYNNEKIIISDFQDFKTSEIMMLSFKMKTIKILNLVHNKRKWKRWIDTSSKKDLPPDFYNPKDKIMMDIMRIDDHTHLDKKGNVVNPYNKRESELIKELSDENPSFKKASEEGRLFIIPDTGLSTDEDHNYDYYVFDFNRVIKKHINKINNYKLNHPGYKMIFFVVDESSPYFESRVESPERIIGGRAEGKIHKWWIDKNMVSCLIDSGIDYLIWMTPYKHFDNNKHFELPCATIMDVNDIKEGELFSYDNNKMYSLEL